MLANNCALSREPRAPLLPTRPPRVLPLTLIKWLRRVTRLTRKTIESNLDATSPEDADMVDPEETAANAPCTVASQSTIVQLKGSTSILMGEDVRDHDWVL